MCWKEQEWEKAVFEVRVDNLKSGGHGGDGERQTNLGCRSGVLVSGKPTVLKTNTMSVTIP